MGQTSSTISGSSSPKQTTSTVQSETKLTRAGYSKLVEADGSFSSSIASLSEHEGEAQPLRVSLDFDEYAISEERKEAEKKPLSVRSSPPDIRHDPSAETKAKASHGKKRPTLFRYNTELPFDPSRLEELEALLKKELGKGTETQYGIALKRSEQNTISIELTIRQKSTLARQQKPAFDKAVASALEAMPSESPPVMVMYPANIKKYALDNVPYDSQLAGTVASIAERILRDVDDKCKVTQHFEKGHVVYKVSKSGSKFDFSSISVPASLKADLFMGLKTWIEGWQAKGKSQDKIAPNHADVARVEKRLREWLSEKYELDLVKDSKMPVEATQKQRPRPVSSPREEKHALPLIESSPPRMEQQHMALEPLHAPKMETSASPPKLVLLGGPPMESYRLSSEIPGRRIKKYESCIRSEMAKEGLLDFFNISLKEVNGTVQVKFSRRFRGGGLPVDRRRLEHVIQRAERSMESHPRRQRHSTDSGLTVVNLED
jgi:hypothetical protein